MDGRQRQLLALLLLVLALATWSYLPTFRSIVEKWNSDASFSHGFLILPISLWLAWRVRAELARTAFVPSALGIAATLACVLAWVVARGTGVLVVEQFAAVALVPALVLAVLGWRATRVLLVPLAFLFFMVPFGRALVPFLMQATAQAATLLLQWTGVPVLRSYMYITIPYGQFEVARACSGLNYFVTSLVLGILYGILFYRGWRKRLLCVAAFVVFPVVLNILRVYVIVLVSYLTEFRFGPGTEHIVFGRVFFLLVVLMMFWIGRRWQDPAAPAPAHGTRLESAAWPRWWPVPVACAVALAGPPVAADSAADALAVKENAGRLVAFPRAADGWAGPAGAGLWRPHYQGGLVERQAQYRDASGVPVDVFVAVYGLGTTAGAEMISYDNVVSLDEHGSLAESARRSVALADGRTLVVREVVVRDFGGERLVWHWYVIGGRQTPNPYVVKALEALAFVTRSADYERVVTVSTPLDDGARARLEAFLVAQGACAAAGFNAEACAG
jgi:exosortase A